MTALQNALKKKLESIQRGEAQKLEKTLKELQEVYQHKQNMLGTAYENEIKRKLETLQKQYVGMLEKKLMKKAEFYQKKVEEGKLTEKQAQQKLLEYKANQEAAVKRLLENEKEIINRKYQTAIKKLEKEFQQYKNLLTKGAETSIQEKAANLSEKAQDIAEMDKGQVGAAELEGKSPGYLGLVGRYLKKLAKSY